MINRTIGNALTLAIVVASCCVGCGPTGPSLGDGYILYRWPEPDIYFVLAKPYKPVTDGVFNGTIKKIAVSDTNIVCLVDPSEGGLEDGWYYCNKKSGNVHGPIGESEVEDRTGIPLNEFVHPRDFKK